MIKIAVFVTGLLFSALSTGADQTTVYLVRHAEKVDSSRDSDLTEVGKARAKAFASLLDGKELTHVFSTPFVRTRNTAIPTASNHGLVIQEYDPDDSSGLANKLKTLRGTIMVTGHSNTIPGLVNALTGENFQNLDERVYDKVYIVTLEAGVYSKLEIIHTEPRTTYP